MELFFAYDEPMRREKPFPSKMRRKNFEHTMRWKANLSPVFFMRDPAVAMDLSYYDRMIVANKTSTTMRFYLTESMNDITKLELELKDTHMCKIAEILRFVGIEETEITVKVMYRGEAVTTEDFRTSVNCNGSGNARRQYGVPIKTVRCWREKKQPGIFGGNLSYTQAIEQQLWEGEEFTVRASIMLFRENHGHVAENEDAPVQQLV